MRYISRFKNSIRASSVYSLAFMLTFALAAGLTTYEEAAAQAPSVTLKAEATLGGNTVTSIMEDADTTQVTVTASLSRAPGSVMKIAVTVAEDDDRYTATDPDTIRVAVGQLTGTTTFDLIPIDDSDYKGDVTIAISGTSPNSFVTGTEFKILDEDSDINLSVNPSVVTEQGGTQSVTVTATVPESGTVDDATTLSLSFDAPDDVTIGGTTEFTIAKDDSTASTVITITPTKDGIYTGNRDIKVTGSSGELVIFPAVIVLQDEQIAPAATIAASPTSLAEEGGAQDVTVTAKLSHASANETKVNVSVTANASRFSAGSPGTISIAAGSTEGTTTLTVTPVDNDVYDGDVPIPITATSAGVTGTITAVSITLVDEDFDINLVASPTFIEEAGGTQSVVVTANLPDGDTADSAMTLTVALSSATASLATLAGTTSITIGKDASQASTTITLAPTPDMQYTGNRNIVVEGTATGLDISPATIELRDAEEAPKVTLTATPMSIMEDAAGTVTVTATLSVAAAASIVVDVSVTENDDRYDTTDPADITVAARSKTAATTFILTPVDDDDYDGDVEIAITGMSGDLTVEGTSITMVDEDFNLELTANTTFVTEQGGTQSVTVTATVPESGTVDDATTLSLSFDAPDGVTIGGTTEFTIAKDDSTASTVITITPTKDGIYTGDRDITVSATSGDLDIRPVDIELRDEQIAPTATIAASPTSLAEEGGAQDVTVTAKLSHASGTNTEVEVSVAEKPAYEASEPASIVIAAGSTEGTTTFTVTPDDNDAYDGDVPIPITATSAGVTGTITAVNITLVDEDFDINLVASPTFIEEAGGTQSVVVTANLPDGDTADSAMTLTVALSSATASLATLAGTTSITIGKDASQGTSTITLAPTPDMQYSGNRDIVVEGTATGLDISPATIELRDAEEAPKVTLTATPMSIMEDAAGTVTVTATLSVAAAASIVVDVSVTENDDRYDTTDPADITVAAGSKTAATTFILTPVDDDDYDGDVEIAITGMSGDLTVEGTSITMVDEDFNLELTANTTFVTEQGGTQSVTVTATVPESGTVDDATTLSLSFDAPDGVTIGGTTEFTIAKDDSTASTVITITPTKDGIYTGDRDITVSATSGDLDIRPVDIELRDEQIAPTATIAASPTSLAEEGGAQDVTVTAKLSHASGTNTEVEVSVAEKPAYEASEPASIVIAAGSTEGTTTFTVTPDDNDAYDGDVAITITATSAGVTGTITAVNITLVDEDFDINLVASPTFIEEAGGTQSVVVTANLPDGDTADSAMTLTVALSSATASLATLSGTTSITIGKDASQGTSTITLAPTPDMQYSGNRDIVVEGTATGLDISPATIELRDAEEAPKVTLTATPMSIMEDAAGTVTVTATLSVAAAASIVVDVSVTENDDRYDTTDPADITVAAGSKTAATTFILTPVDDDDYDGDVEIAITGMSGDLTVEGTSITMVDEDFNLELTANTTFVTEQGGMQSVTVTATVPESGTVVDDATTLMLSVDAPDDVTIGGTMEITIAKDDSTASTVITITPTKDGIYTGDRDITVSATSGDLDIRPVDIELRDEQIAPTATIAASPTSLAEEGGAQDVTVTAKLSHASGTNTEVEVSVAEKPAYEASEPASIVIAAGSTEGTTTFTVTPDDNDAYDGDVPIPITATSAGVTGTITEVNITLVDEDFDVSLSVDPESIEEDGGAQSFTVEASLPAGETADDAITITLAFERPTGVTAASMPITGTISITIGKNASKSSTSITIAPTDDGNYTGARLIKVTGTSGTLEIAPASIELQDAQSAMVQLSVDPAEIMEHAGATDVTVTATIDDKLATETVVILSKSGSATENEDYTVTGESEITIGVGQTSATTTLTITPEDDLMFEDGEMIEIGGTADDYRVHSASITLIDNNAVPLASVEVDVESISEDGDAVDVTITATLAGSSGEDIVIDLGTSSGTAQPGDDFDVMDDPAAGDFIIAAGDTMATKTVTITPIDDLIDEGDEIINVDATAMLNGVVIGDGPMTAMITLVDNDLIPIITLSTDVLMIAEDGEAQEVEVTATLESVSFRTLEVVLAQSGTATQGEDYSVSGEGTIMIAAGDLTGFTTLTVTPVDDPLYEGDESIGIDGSVESNPETVTAVGTSIALIDNEAEPVITLAINPSMITEEGGTQPVEVTATTDVLSALDLAVSLLPVIDASTATLFGPDADGGILELTAGGLTVTIPAGQASGSLTLTIVPIDDDVYEAAEHVVLVGQRGESMTEPVMLGIVDSDVPMVVLSANPMSISEGAGSQNVTFDAMMSGSPVHVPTVISLSESGTASQGTDYVQSGNAEIVIPAGQVSGSTQLSFAVVDDDVYEPDNEIIVVTASWGDSELSSVSITIVDNYAAPAVTSALPDMTLEAGDSRQADVSGSFSGKALNFSASSSDDGVVSADISGSSLTITGNRKGSARITVVASNEAGSASFDLGVTVTAIAAERMVYTDILAAMGRNIMSSVSNSIGGRFSVTAAERQIALANRRVDGMASGMEALISLTGTHATTKYGITDETTERSRRQPVSTRELMRGSSFYYALDDAPQGGMEGGLSWTIWGAGDWNAFEGAPSATASYDGTLTSGYVGLDVSKTASWIAGVAVGRSMGTSDYDVSVTDGTLEATLNSVYPYVHWTGPSCCIEIWGIGGFGTGEVEANEQMSDLSMTLGMVGVRAQLVGSTTGGLDLDLIGDAGITKLSTSDSESASLSDLEASVQRVRIGLEGSRTSDMGNGMLVTPFAQLAGRYDGGDGQTGNGLEIAGGIRITGGRAGIEARGRLLAMHTGEEVKEHGVSVVAFVKPMGNGTGMSMSIAPRLGADTDMSRNMWRDDAMTEVTRTSRSGAGVKAEIGYGLMTPMMSSILVTPFGTMDMAGEDQRRMRLGARFGSIGDMTSVLSFEFAGERIEGNGRTPDHRIGLLGRMSF